MAHLRNPNQCTANQAYHLIDSINSSLLVLGGLVIESQQVHGGELNLPRVEHFLHETIRELSALMESYRDSAPEVQCFHCAFEHPTEVC